jgi:hypothetical protein
MFKLYTGVEMNCQMEAVMTNEAALPNPRIF